MTYVKVRAIFDAVPDAIVALDEQGRIARINPATEALFGYGSDELRGRPVEVLIPDGLREVGRGGGPGAWGRPAGSAAASIGRLGRRKDGSEVPVEIRIGTAEEDGGRLVVCVIRDISDRERPVGPTQDAPEQAGARLVQAEQLAAHGEMVAGVAYKSNDRLAFLSNTIADLRRDFVDPRELAQLYEGAEDRARIRELAEAHLALPKRLAALAREVDRVAHEVNNPLAFIGHHLAALRRELVDPDDQSRPGQGAEDVGAGPRPVARDRGGTVARPMRAQYVRELAQRVAGIACETSNPLAYTCNSLAVLRRKCSDLRELVQLYREAEDEDDGRRPEALARVRERAEQLDLPDLLAGTKGLFHRTRGGLEQIRWYFNYLRDDGRLAAIDPGEADLDDRLRSAVGLIAGRAERQGVEVVLDRAPMPPIACDPGKVDQVLLHLLANALDACPDGGRVTLRTRPTAEGVELHVIDTGHGIDPAVRGRIFDPFFTTRPVGRGSGLGLSISSGIVHLHGGEIAVESEPGRGAHFTVTLPYAYRGEVPSSRPTTRSNTYNHLR
jgi:PAS domain S-box-containing protein